MIDIKCGIIEARAEAPEHAYHSLAPSASLLGFIINFSAIGAATSLDRASHRVVSLFPRTRFAP